MRFQQYITAISLLFFFYGCSNTANEETQSLESISLSKNLVRTDTVQVSLPDTIPHHSSQLGLYFNSDSESVSYLTASNDYSFQVNRLSISTKEWNQISLNLEGPHRVYGEGAYSIIDEKVYYFPLNESKLIILDKNGHKLNEHLYSDDRMIAYNSQVKAPNVYVKDSKVYFDITEYRRLEDLSTFEKSKLIGVYDTDNDSFETIVNYPNEFSGKAWSPNDVGRNFVIVEDKIYLSFSKSKNIYVYDLEGRLLKKGKVRTEGIKDSQGLKDSDPFANALSQLNNGHYDRIIYDKWRKVFYRIGVYMDVNFDLKSPEDFANALDKRTMSIITFNSNLEVIGKNEFKSVETGLAETPFYVSQEGLFFNAYLENNTNNPEDIYHFVKLELKELE